MVTFGPRTRPDDAPDDGPAEESTTFEAYAAARGAALVRFAMLLTGDGHRAEDLVQEALTKAYFRWARIRQSDNPDVYLRRLVINGSRSWWRRRANRETPGLGLTELSAPGDLGADAAARDELWRLIAALPDQQRAVVVLRYFADLTEAQIAEAMGCSVGTVKSQHAKALTTLRRHTPAEDR